MLQVMEGLVELAGEFGLIGLGALPALDGDVRGSAKGALTADQFDGYADGQVGRRLVGCQLAS